MNTLLGQLLPASGIATYENVVGETTDVSIAEPDTFALIQRRFALLLDHDPTRLRGQCTYLEIDNAGRLWGAFDTVLDELDERRFLSLRTDGYRRASSHVVIGSTITEASLVVEPAALVAPATLISGNLAEGNLRRPAGLGVHIHSILDRAARVIERNAPDERRAGRVMIRHETTPTLGELARTGLAELARTRRDAAPPSPLKRPARAPAQDLDGWGPVRRRTFDAETAKLRLR